jgi:glycogen synthase
LMGALERDTGTDFENPNTSPLALVCRSTACRMLGGDTKFASMMQESKKVGTKILIDCVARISSKNYHRRYKNKFLFYRNPQGIPVVCYGSDGRAINFEDSAMLNYRQADVWQLLVEDITEFTKKFQIDGIHIDNAQSWPQIMELDREEMYRNDTDGNPHYSTQEIFDGLVVKRNEKYAYWDSDLRYKYSNPIFIKLCKELWREFPDFLIVADIWNGTGMEERDKCIANSGPIPRLYDLPVKLSALFGKKLHKNGTYDYIKEEDVSIMKKWYDDLKSSMPEGALIIQSSTGHCLPYPALLYGRGAWAAVDVLFFMPFIPMSFIGEQDGHAYRSKISSLYDYDDATRPSILPSSISSNSLIEIQDNMSQSSIPRTASTSSFSHLPDIKELETKEETFQKDLGPEFGFDIKKIKFHYQHRRSLRNEKQLLRTGELVELVMKHDHGTHGRVLAFARCLANEIAVILINLNGHPVNGFIELGNLSKFLLGDGMCVFTMEEWFSSNSDRYYFREEILADKHIVSILPYRSHIIGIYPSNVPSEQALVHSILRLKESLSKNLYIEGNYFIHNLKNFIISDKLVQNFQNILNVLGMIQKHFLDVYSVSAHQLVKKFTTFDENHIGKLLGICDYIIESNVSAPHLLFFAENFVKSNKMGPIVFTCPELGRFSTVGGLGVMVDELAQGLAELGEEVWVISPYYEKNKKGQTGYLTNDKAGIRWVFNIQVQFGGENYTMGLHQGYENGVNLVFLHNLVLFPSVYADGKPQFVVRQLVGWAKGVLEALCCLKVIPSILITNDWFTGLVAAYAKIGAFGSTFEGTTFLHIIHNLDPSYEGRIFTVAADNYFVNIHGLPKHVLVDPYWAKEIVNPSRSAIVMSDQWATVSPSYRNELLATSPLKEILKNKAQPFAYPNGIPIKQRLQKLEGKGTHLDAKKALQQKYFGFQDLDDTIPLFGFVGRITEQKGVHLILDAAEILIPSTGYKIQFLVGGPVTVTEKYSVNCGIKIKDLRNRYPNNFFADPDNFFYEGPLVNLGSDFGLMPSLFEPGGIVQHEFFVAGTPVIAFKTGGLRDTVHEFIVDQGKGCGFIFEKYFAEEFVYAIRRALDVYYNKKLYNIIRKNAFEATVDGDKVARAWNKEFYRLKGKIFYEFNLRSQVKKFLDESKLEVHDFDESLPENRNKNPPMKRTASGILIEQHGIARKSTNEFEGSKKQFMFSYKTTGLRLKSVQLTGSFDKWQIRHALQYDHAKGSWHVTLQLPKGRFSYKFVIDGNTWVHSFDHPSETDASGNINNFVEIV